MELAGTTSISQLPINPQTEQINNVVQNENIKIDNYPKNEIIERNNDPTLEQKTYTQLVSGLQQASAAGQTGLPSRDIPQDTTSLVQDEQIKPNYIPPSQKEDYISDETLQDINNNKQNEQNMNNLEHLYQEFQLPLLVGVLYFLFQLPVIQKYLYKIIPGLFNSDGNPNLYGYIFNSLTFGLIYFVLLKSMKYFSNI